MATSLLPLGEEKLPLMIFIVDPLPRDPDLNVRRVALVAFNSAAHNKPSLIRDLLREVLPQVPES